MDKLAYSVEEAADLIGISRRMIYELIRTRELGSLRIGTRRLIRQADQVSYLEGLEAA